MSQPLPIPHAPPPALSKWRMCDRKVAHVSERAAKRHAKRLHKTTSRTYNVYHCPYCQHYHVGGAHPGSVQ